MTTSYKVEAKLTAVDHASKVVLKLNAAYAKLAKTQAMMKSGASKMAMPLEPMSLRKVNVNVNGIDKVTDAYNRQAKALQHLNSIGIRSANVQQSNMKRGKTWAESSTIDRMKWRAGAHATYGSFNKVGVGASAGGQGITEGSRNRSLNKLIYAESPETKATIEKLGTEISNEYRTQTAGAIQEALRTADSSLQDKRQMGDIARVIGKVAQAVTLNNGGDARLGADSAGKLTKTADLMGMADNAKEFNIAMEALTKVLLSGGKDLKADQVKEYMKSAKGAKRGLNSDAIITIGQMADEYGGKSGGESLRMFADDLTRSNLAVKNKETLKSYGLRTETGAADYKLLQANPFEWVEKKVVPILEKMGVDLTDAGAVGEAITKLGFQKGSSEFVKFNIDKRDEIKSNLDRTRKIDISEKSVKALVGTDIQSTNAAVASQFKNAVDAQTKTLQPIYSSIMGGLAGGLNSLANSEETPNTVKGMIALPTLAVSKVFKDGNEGVNNKLIVANGLLGKIAFNTGIGGIGGSLSGIARTAVKFAGAAGAVAFAVEGLIHLGKKTDALPEVQAAKEGIKQAIESEPVKEIDKEIKKAHAERKFTKAGNLAHKKDRMIKDAIENEKEKIVTFGNEYNRIMDDMVNGESAGRNVKNRQPESADYDNATYITPQKITAELNKSVESASAKMTQSYENVGGILTTSLVTGGDSMGKKMIDSASQAGDIMGQRMKAIIETAIIKPPTISAPAYNFPI
jgi:hypothetical protein